MTTKKGQGLSLNTIIIAIIVLIVLVVLVMIFTGYFGKVFTPSVASCPTQGGECLTVAECDDKGAFPGEKGKSINTKDCTTASKVCCLKGQSA
ncbi:hypothetical protein HYY73_05435 [Candidatus Woesearchaeota archaeon]|nr:hypothetical protein [Candidatus Woesearchaeota archaeon]